MSKTATERLRMMLDERGVEHRDTTPDRVPWKNWVTEVRFPDRWASAIETVNGDFTVTLYGYTPEQVVAALLRDIETCHKVREWEDDPVGPGGYVLVCSRCDCILAQDGEDGPYDGPNYCPRCGRRVVRE